MINIEFKISGMSEVLDELSDAATKSQLVEANKIAGEYLREYICSWYDKKGLFWEKGN